MLVACSGNRQTFQQIRTSHPAQDRMDMFLIIVYAPDFDVAPSILQRHEPVFIQALQPQFAVERPHSDIVR